MHEEAWQPQLLKYEIAFDQRINENSETRENKRKVSNIIKVARNDLQHFHLIQWINVTPLFQLKPRLTVTKINAQLLMA